MPSPRADSLPPLPPSDLYRLVRSQVEFEASLIAQRLSWLVASQSFLFSAYAIALNAPREPALPAYAAQRQLLYSLVPLVGVAAGALIYLSLLAGLLAQSRLREYLRRRLPEGEDFPPVQGALVSHRLGLAAPLCLPLVFIVVWIVLWTHSLG